MFFKNTLLFFFLTLSVCFFQPAIAQNNSDYKNWTLSELLFSIDSDLLNADDKEIYLEYYLQKAKQEQETQDIARAYQKKVYFYEDYTIASTYADSLLTFSKEVNNNQIIGIAYDLKRYLEYVNKNYEKALDYSLKAEHYLEKANDQSTLHTIKSAISAIYYHLEEYGKSEKITKEVLLYYKNTLNKTPNDYNNLRGYITNIYTLSKINFRQQKNDSLRFLLDEGYKVATELKTKDKELETAYLNLVDGMYHHRLKQFTSSDSLLTKALPFIQYNGDFANEHLAYLYLGKNAWEQGKRDKALSYFEKIEHLYQDHQFANAELSEAFSYIITYYQDNKNLEKELYYTKLLMEISSKLHKNNSQVSSYMHTYLDTKTLEASQKNLEYELSKSKSQIKVMYVIVVVLVCIVFLGLLYYQKTQVKLKQQYGQLMHQQAQHLPLPNFSQQKESTALDLSTIKLPDCNNELLSTTKLLYKKLEDFEEKKGFLQKITQDELARQFGTNRNTLSKFFNEEKGINFSDYLKQVRIQYAVHELTYNPKLHLLNLTGLAEKFGFGSSKSFSIAFKEMTQISVMDFIKMRKQDEDFKEKDNAQIESKEE